MLLTPVVIEDNMLPTDQDFVTGSTATFSTQSSLDSTQHLAWLLALQHLLAPAKVQHTFSWVYNANFATDRFFGWLCLWWCLSHWLCLWWCLSHWLNLGRWILINYLAATQALCSSQRQLHSAQQPEDYEPCHEQQPLLQLLLQLVIQRPNLHERHWRGWREAALGAPEGRSSLALGDGVWITGDGELESIVGET